MPHKVRLKTYRVHFTYRGQTNFYELQANNLTQVRNMSQAYLPKGSKITRIEVKDTGRRKKAR